MTLTTRSTGSIVKVDVVTGGAGYTKGATLSGAVVNVAGGVVENVVITGAVTGLTLGAVTGSSASLTAKTYSGSQRPMSFFQGRYGEVYGVDGMGRGIRIDGSTFYPIGVAKPAITPTVTASSTGGGDYISGIHMVRNGNGYIETPTVLINGVSNLAKAVMRNGAVDAVTIIANSATYTQAPTVAFTGGMPSGHTFGVTVGGGVASIGVKAGGSGYTASATTKPSVVFSTAQGLTGAYAIPFVDETGAIAGVQVLYSGTGATTTGVTASIAGGGGSGASVVVDMRYTVTGVTVVSGGTGHVTPPIIAISAASTDNTGGGAYAEAAVSGGAITGVTVYEGGLYEAPPTAEIIDTHARAVATLAKPILGRYLCALRYIDNTPPSKGGPIPSSISELAEVNVVDGAGSIVWTISHQSADSRVSQVELWRTTSDQSVVLYRVATLSLGTTTYTDSLRDVDLLDVTRAGYGMMPITLPSGLVNARRFEVPPANYGVGVMFQDRAWYAVDTTGDRPNSLMYSEVDEPESVPFFNEIVIQENAGENDKVVALCPFGSQLLVAQTGHLYSLTYVSQPVIDAAVGLVAYRGVLNDSCWTVMNGVAFFADSYGVYAFDGQSETPLSDPVDNYWREQIIDFSKTSQFHMSSDFTDKVIRFHYCQSGDSSPTRALCYCVSTKAWWEEQYHVAVTASCTSLVAGRRAALYGTGGSGFVRPASGADANGSAVPWLMRSGNVRLGASTDRAIGILYTPTASDNSLDVRLHYNGSTSPRPNAIAVDTGNAFTQAQGGTSAQLNMKVTRSALGDATGYAQAHFAGRIDPRSVGTDRHVAVAMAGTQSSQPVRIHGITLTGAE